MESIKLNDWKFEVDNDQIKVLQYDKSMGMFEQLKTYDISDLLEITNDFEVKTYRTAVIPKFIMETLTAYLKSKGETI
jgi:hypothetical protein